MKMAAQIDRVNDLHHDDKELRPGGTKSWTPRQAIHGGDLPAIDVGKLLLIARADLEAFLQRRRTALPGVPARARG